MAEREGDTQSTRRAVLKRSGRLAGLLTLGLAGATPAAGGSADRPGDGTDADNAAASWTRLYQGTAAVTVSYFTDFDREASGGFAVDVRFRESETLATDGPPFAFTLQTGVLLDGDFVAFETPGPLPSLPLIEGSVWIETESGSTQTAVVQPWEVMYDAQTEEVQGTVVQPSEYWDIVNSVLALGPGIVGGYIPDYKQASTQSTFEGTIGEEALDLRFEIVDVDQTIAATIEISAERRA